MILRSLLAALACLLWLNAPAAAQTPSGLVADRVTRDANTILAEGNVQVFVDGNRLSATRLTYDRRTGHMALQGPITIVAQDGTIFTAQSAELGGDQGDLLVNMRALIAQRLQVTAAQATRKGARSALTHVAATSCTVCPGKTPIWEIRARSITHNAEAQRIWLRGAHFRVKGVPVLPLPGFSLPEPGVARARGWIRPSAGLGGKGYLKLPYFLPLGDHRDLTITPWLGRKGQNLGLRYRQSFAHADLVLDTLMARGSDGRARGAWARASLTAELGQNWRLGGDLEAVSDRDFLNTLDIDDRKQLDSTLQLYRIMPRSLVHSQITHYTPLRQTQAAWDHPAWVTQARIEARRPLAGGFAFGGVVLDAHSRHRQAKAGSIEQARLGAFAGYDGRAVIGPGLELAAQFRLQNDAYWTQALGGTARNGQRGKAEGRVMLSWPLVSQRGAVRQTITPRLSLQHRRVWGYAPANQDSPAPVLELAGLHSFAQPGEDRQTDARRLSASVEWRADLNSGRAVWASLGRMLQDSPAAGATDSTGLATRRSDWVLALGAESPHWLIDSAFALGERGQLHRAAARARWQGTPGWISATYAFASADSAAGRNRDLAELRLASGWRLNDTTQLDLGGRFDLGRGEAVDSNIALNWRNECLSLQLSASHKFASSFNVSPSTTYQVAFSVEGFSTTSQVPVRSCTN